MSLYDKTSSVLRRKSSVIFGYLRQSLENVYKSSSGRRHLYVYIIKGILHARLWIRILSFRVQLDISLASLTSVGCQVEHSKIKFISARGHVVSSIS